MKIIMKKRIFVFVGVILLVLAYFTLQISEKYHWHKAIQAVSTFPTQLGLTGVTLTQCTVSCTATCCIGGALCSTLDPGRCATYQEAKGSMAGGTGNMGLFSTANLSTAGVKNGGQLIAGCNSMTECDSGVLAGEGGCAGSACTAIADHIFFKGPLRRLVDSTKVYMAGFKDFVTN